MNRLLAALIAGAIAVGLVWLVIGMWKDARESRARAALSTNQAQAVSDSAKDAVATVGAAGERETANQNQTERNDADIRAAKGADAAVDPAARDAGLRSLCGRRVYSGHPECLRFADPADVGQRR